MTIGFFVPSYGTARSGSDNWVVVVERSRMTSRPTRGTTGFEVDAREGGHMRRVIVLAMVVALMLLTIPPALAGGTAHCGSGGFGYTYSNAFGNHTFGSSYKPNINGTAGHGYFAGNQWWDVSPNPPTENGWCVL